MLASTLAMSHDEQRERMHRLRQTVQQHDAHAWASRMLSDVLETCNGTDDDCDGAVDDSPTDQGGSCGQSNIAPCARVSSRASS